MALQSLFGNNTGSSAPVAGAFPWMQQQALSPTTDQKKTISSIPGVTFNKPTGWVDEYGGNGELTGQSQWGNYFSGLENLGEGYDVQDVIGQGTAGIGGAPSSFTIRRQDPNGDPNYYQQRQLTLNPDGTVGWADGSNWTSVKQQSQMDHFLSAGLPMALAGYGAMTGLEGLMSGAAGNGAFLGEGAASGVPSWDAASGMFPQLPGYGAEVATLADATGASPFTGAVSETAGSGLLPGTGTTGLQATPGSGLSLAAPTGTGTGLSVPGIGGSVAGGGTMDILKGLGKSLIGGQGGGISNLGNLASLFSNYKQYSNSGDLIDEIKSIYSPEGVYAKELEKQLARRDAAAGRNSQYGPRLAELMARLGDSQARSLSGLGGMMSTEQGGLNGMLGAGQRVLEGTGILDKLFSIFGD